MRDYLRSKKIMKYIYLKNKLKSISTLPSLTGMLLCCFLLPAFHANAQREIVDKVIATVGGELVLLSDLEEQYSYMQTQRGAVPADARCLMMDQLILNNLLLNQAKLDSIEISDGEVQQELDTRVDQILRQMNGDVNQFESYYGQTMGEVKESFRDDLKNKKLVDKMRAKITADISVTPSEVQAFFALIPKDSLPYFNAEVELGEIVYQPKPNPVQKKIALDKLTDIRKRIVEGKEDFAKLAEKYSDDPGSGRAGGDLGWAKRGTFVPAFEAAAYKLEPNEITAVTETEFGYHIIQLIERRGNTIHARHILLKPKVTEEDLTASKAKLDSVRTKIIDKKLTFSKAVKDYSDKNAQSYHNDGRMVNAASGNGIFEVADLDPTVYFATEELKVGEISKPIELAAPGSGEMQYKLVKLLSRTDPHKANLRQDYNKIQTAALDQKKNTYTSKWFLDKVGHTYMSIEASTQKQCPALVKWVENKKL
jgi:peptidyl-prolyl cis-trans isomerase SurA